MSQTWDPPIGADTEHDAIVTKLPAQLEALRTLFSGASAPSATVARMLWADTTTGLLKQRNAADSGWDVVARLQADWTEHSVMIGELASLSASRKLYLPPQRVGWAVRRIVVVSDTASTSSSGNEWRFTLKNITQASAALFSGTVGNFTALGGVGGGAEFVANSAFALTPNQNNTLAANDVLEFELVKAGTVTTLARVAVFAELSRAA